MSTGRTDSALYTLEADLLVNILERGGRRRRAVGRAFDEGVPGGDGIRQQCTGMYVHIHYR